MSGAATVVDPLGVTGVRRGAKKLEDDMEEKARNRAGDDSARATAEVQAATAAAEAAALEKNQESQRTALKRKGRRASILTSGQGVVDPIKDQLGIPG